MRVILDTNVILSSIFFGGIPGRILEAYRNGQLALVLSPEILDEYRATAARLAKKFSTTGRRKSKSLLEGISWQILFARILSQL